MINKSRFENLSIHKAKIFVSIAILLLLMIPTLRLPDPDYHITIPYFCLTVILCIFLYLRKSIARSIAIYFSLFAGPIMLLFIIVPYIDKWPNLRLTVMDLKRSLDLKDIIFPLFYTIVLILLALPKSVKNYFQNSAHEKSIDELRNMQKTITQIKTKLKIGMSLKEVKNLLGPVSVRSDGASLMKNPPAGASVVVSSSTLQSMACKDYMQWQRPEGTYSLVFQGGQLIRIFSAPSDIEIADEVENNGISNDLSDFDKIHQMVELMEFLKTRSEDNLVSFIDKFPLSELKLDIASVLNDFRNSRRMESLLYLARMLLRWKDYASDPKWLSLAPRNLDAPRLYAALSSRLFPFLEQQRGVDIDMTLRIALYDFAMDLIGEDKNREAMLCLEISRPSPREDHDFWLCACYQNIGQTEKDGEVIRRGLQLAQVMMADESKLSASTLRKMRQTDLLGKLSEMASKLGATAEAPSAEKPMPKQ